VGDQKRDRILVGIRPCEDAALLLFFDSFGKTAAIVIEAWRRGHLYFTVSLPHDPSPGIPERIHAEAMIALRILDEDRRPRHDRTAEVETLEVKPLHRTVPMGYASSC
jgi:hypothetical protein